MFWKTVFKFDNKLFLLFSTRLGYSNFVLLQVQQIGELAKSFLWDSFFPVRLDDTLFHVLLLLSKHRLQVVPVIERPDSKDIGFVTQVPWLQGINQHLVFGYRSYSGRIFFCSPQVQTPICRPALDQLVIVIKNCWFFKRSKLSIFCSLFNSAARGDTNSQSDIVLCLSLDNLLLGTW